MFAKAARIIQNARSVVVFTGAGISVESGIPPFRGNDGLWTKYDPSFLDISRFNSDPKSSWVLIKEIFYDFWGQAEPNAAHKSIAVLEEHGMVDTVVTQNIDNLHQAAGSKRVWEFHGTLRVLSCMSCSKRVNAADVDFESLPPKCSCGGILKPDFVFFGEPIPEPANSESFRSAENADAVIVIGTAGEVMPACMIPYIAKRNGAAIIEINTHESLFTGQITDVFLKGKAAEQTTLLLNALNLDGDLEKKYA